MPELTFQVESVAAVPFAAAPLLAFSLRVANGVAGETIHTVALRCQLHLEVTRRNYSPAEKERLHDLFGEPSRWGQTLRPMLWTHVSTVIPEFTGSTTVEMQTPCTFDFNVAATKYFHGLDGGEAPVAFLFSGTVYYRAADGALQVAPIAWDKEARFRLPAKVWREMMDSYYPNSAWLCLRRDVFERLHRYKMDHSLPTWEQTLDSMLAQVEEGVAP
jgi:hypothetical protein